MGSEQTTATAATAGAAAGTFVGWLIGVSTGIDVAPAIGALSILGAFFFGRIFGP